MHLVWVELRDFRNHIHTHLQPLADGLIVVVGPNGEGKTNLLEGMFFLFSLVSPRTTTNLPLVREGRDAAYARGEVESLGGRILVEAEVPLRGTSRVRVNGTAVRRKRDLRRQVRAVFFGPDDVDIVRGDPAQRRRFLDEAVISLWPIRESVLTAYDRALRQRNRLLKEWDGRGAPPGLEVWDEELVAAGSAVMRVRHEAAGLLAPCASGEFEALSGHGLSCEYAPRFWTEDDLEEAFRAALRARRADEIARRTTLVGPHRDDLGLAVRDLGARAFASHGEAWAAALCLRLGLASAVEGEVGEPAVLLVDDPFSALDPRRRHAIAERLAARGGQVLVSVADEAHVPGAVHATWDVRGGSVKQRKAA